MTWITKDYLHIKQKRMFHDGGLPSFQGSDPGPWANSPPHASSPPCTPRVEEDLDVLQGVGGSTGHVRDQLLSAKRLDYTGFVQLTVDPRHMSQAGRGQGMVGGS